MLNGKSEKESSGESSVREVGLFEMLEIARFWRRCWKMLDESWTRCWRRCRRVTVTSRARCAAGVILG